jgi:hypothetical protein
MGELFMIDGLFVVQVYNLKALMLGIFSWNIGNNAKGKIPPYIAEIKKKCNPLPDLLVFGFQEVQEDLTKITQIMQQQLTDYTIINGKTACEPITTYQIVTLVMQKTDKNRYIIDENNQKSACLTSEGKKTFLLFGTKGYTITVIQGPKNFIFVNTHFPLKTADILEDFYHRVNNAIDNLGLFNHLVFVFGDVNSRCYEYQKEVKTCENDADKQLKHCQVKKQLEILEFPQTFNFAALPSSQELDRLITDLTTNDHINKNKNSIFNGYTEPEIRFLPTYKRDANTGKFHLVIPGNKSAQNAERAGRLPGYADRIFYRNNPKITCLNYGSFGVKGNDHLPIGGIFTIKATGGRQRKKSRVRSKSRKTQKRSKSRKTQKNKVKN